jgi:DNA (cytosine-5)-methyltransferase 1
MNKKYSFTFADLFSGIGGFRIPLEEAGGKCVGFSEVDKVAIKCYKDNFEVSNELEMGDITKIEDIPKVDIVTGGVPCQSWSVAGKRKGFEDPRGKLWFDTIQFVKKAEPKAFIFENVKGLADPRNIESLKLIIESFEEIGYRCKYEVLNAFDYGLPQNRERIFIVGIQKDIKLDFEYPIAYDHLPNLADILENHNSINIAIKNDSNIKNSFNLSANINKGNFFTFCDTRNGDNTIHSWDLTPCSDNEVNICMTLLKNRRKSMYGNKDGNPLTYKNLQDLIGVVDIEDLESLVDKKILIKKEGKYDFFNTKNSAGINNIYRIFLPCSHVFSTLTKTGVKDFVSNFDIPHKIKNRKEYFINKIFKQNEYRKVSIREAARIQGFPDWLELPVNYNNALGLIGNALGVNIVRELIKGLSSIMNSEYEESDFELANKDQLELTEQIQLF